MALKLNTTIKGIKLKESYWAITSLSWNKISNSTMVGISCYSNESTRADNLNDAITYLNFEFYGQYSIAGCYELIKQDEFFAKAVDILED